MSFFKNFSKKKKVALGGVILLLLLAIFKIMDGDNGGERATLSRRDIVQEVSVTGKTKAVNEVNLGFDRTGRVGRSSVSLGQKVGAGQMIAELDIQTQLANLAKERALLAQEEANFSSREESLVSSIQEAYATADNAIRNKTDQFFKQPRENPIFEVKFTDGNFVHYFNIPNDLAYELNSERKTIEIILQKWQQELPNINTINAKDFGGEALSRLNTISSFLNKIAYAINSFSPAEFSYESTVVGYKTAIDSARDGVDTARSNLISAKENTSPKIAQIKSSILALEAEIAKSRIVAPFSGTVTKQDAKVGSIAVAGSELVSIISENQMYLEANISEINIGKVTQGNKVSIEFDAFPSEIFEGEVIYIEPGETIIDGVVNYKTRIKIDPNHQSFAKIRSGLTANLKIEVAKKEAVLSIPSYAVIKTGDQNFVNKVNGKEVEKVPVTLGIAGSGGFVEILSGLEEGDMVEF